MSTIEKVTMPNGRTAYRHEGRLLTPDAAQWLMRKQRKAARDTDHCKGCNSADLFSGYFSSRRADSRRLSDMLATECKTAVYCTVCNNCGKFQ